MSKPVVAGRKHISSKPRPSGLGLPDFFRNPLQLSPELIDEIESQGFEYRWINYNTLVDSHGMHRWGWKVYKPKTISAEAQALGLNPDGIIRHKNDVLAVRSKEICEQHREWLKERRDNLKRFKKDKTQELREKAKGTGVKVHEGYEDEGDEN